MAFLNLGEKDEYGRQRRVEALGRYLRASRTGGVALRARAIAPMRPRERLEDLTAVDGIGAQMLQAIREHGVVCDGARTA